MLANNTFRINCLPIQWNKTARLKFLLYPSYSEEGQMLNLFEVGKFILLIIPCTSTLFTTIQLVLWYFILTFNEECIFF